jgi:hypothetical protein
MKSIFCKRKYSPPRFGSRLLFLTPRFHRSVLVSRCWSHHISFGHCRIFSFVVRAFWSGFFWRKGKGFVFRFSVSILVQVAVPRATGARLGLLFSSGQRFCFAAPSFGLAAARRRAKLFLSD